MSQTPLSPPLHAIRTFLQGLRNVAAFLGESALAVIEVVMGRWPLPFSEKRPRPEVPNEGLGPIDKIAPFPADE